MPQPPANQERNSPLVIVTEKHDLTPEGYFRPAAYVRLTSHIRTSGLLQALPPEELKSFFVVLSFLTANGHCWPTLLQLADAMRVSPVKARMRMRRLCEVRFGGEPLVNLAPHGDGQEAYALNRNVVPLVEGTVPEAAPEPQGATLREQVIEHSRQSYAREREEVEQQIAELNGWDKRGQDEPGAEDASTHIATPENEQLRELRRRLKELGVLEEQIDYLFKNFEAARIQRQLDWLPYRHKPQRPSAYVMAAIIRDYGEPIYRR